MTAAGGAGSGLNHWPFLVFVVLLLVLILITPTFLPGAPPAGSLSTQGQIVVDRGTGWNRTLLYVEGLGTVRYASVSVGLTPNVTWPPPANGNNLTFRNWTNATDVVVLSLMVYTNLTAVNASVTYVDSNGVSVTYVALYVLYVQQQTLYVAPLLAGLPSVSPIPFSDLPLGLSLEPAPVPGAP